MFTRNACLSVLIAKSHSLITEKRPITTIRALVRLSFRLFPGGVISQHITTPVAPLFTSQLLTAEPRDLRRPYIIPGCHHVRLLVRACRRRAQRVPTGPASSVSGSAPGYALTRFCTAKPEGGDPARVVSRHDHLSDARRPQRAVRVGVHRPSSSDPAHHGRQHTPGLRYNVPLSGIPNPLREAWQGQRRRTQHVRKGQWQLEEFDCARDVEKINSRIACSKGISSSYKITRSKLTVIYLAYNTQTLWLGRGVTLDRFAKLALPE